MEVAHTWVSLGITPPSMDDHQKGTSPRQAATEDVCRMSGEIDRLVECGALPRLPAGSTYTPGIDGVRVYRRVGPQ